MKHNFDWLNHTVQPIRSCVTFKFTKFWRKRQRTFLRMVGEYGPWLILCNKHFPGNTYGAVLTHYQTTNFRLFQIERLCRQQFKI